MKANGKNYKMYYYETHDNMDMYPEQHFATYKCNEDANKYIKNMRKYWSSGTVSDAKIMSPIKFFMARQSRYWKGCEEAMDNAALDCTQDWLDEYSFYVEHKDWDITALHHAWLNGETFN